MFRITEFKTIWRIMAQPRPHVFVDPIILKAPWPKHKANGKQTRCRVNLEIQQNTRNFMTMVKAKLENCRRCQGEPEANEQWQSDKFQ